MCNPRVLLSLLGWLPRLPQLPRCDRQAAGDRQRWAHSPTLSLPSLHLFVQTPQVYAPVDDNPEAFHRTLSLFICPDGDKLAQAGTGGQGSKGLCSVVCVGCRA